MIRPPHAPLHLSIVLPCRNEEASIERVVASALAQGERVARLVTLPPRIRRQARRRPSG